MLVSLGFNGAPTLPDQTTLPDRTGETSPSPPLPPALPSDGVPRFFASGLFFMIVGTVFLIVAAKTMGPTHSMFSFVLVVVGIAILLFGTGTQSAGEFASPAEAANYKVKIAGGAGAIAIIVALGIVFYGPKMKSAFQIEKKYFVVKVQPLSGNTFENYLAQFSIEGMPVPSMQRGNFMMVYVPYLESEEKTSRPVQYRFKHIGKEVPELQRGEIGPLSFEVEIDENNLERRDASLDFPMYCKRNNNSKTCAPIEVNMQSAGSAQRQAERAIQMQTTSPTGLRPPENTPAIVTPSASQF